MIVVLQRLRWLLGAAVLALAGIMLWRQVQALSLADVRLAWATTSPGAIAVALLGTAVSFACLAAFEVVATRRAVPGRVPVIVALQVGAVSHAIANTLGFHALSGGAMRLRGYRRFGLGVADVARVVAVVAACVAVGVVTIAAIELLWLQVATRALTQAWMLAVVLGLVGAGVAIVWRTRTARPGTSAAWPLLMRDAGWVSLLGALEMAAAIGSLYVLLPAGAAPPLAAFVLVCVGAMLLGIVSHAPGGVGVFEAAILAALPGARHAEGLVALLLYRLLYNLLPFALATTSLLVASARSGRRLAGSVGGRV